KGKAFHDEVMKTAQTKGSGWVDYWLPRPGQTEPSRKRSYVKAVKAKGVALVGAGFFPERSKQSVRLGHRYHRCRKIGPASLLVAQSGHIEAAFACPHSERSGHG